MSIIVTLRERLRAETRRAHDAVDAAFGRLDVGTPDGLAAFLRAQASGIAAMRAAATGSGEGAAAAWDVALDDIAADLSVLGARAPKRAKPPVDDHPLARAYIWHGSRLGTRMLARRWEGATDPVVRQAGHYFGRAPDRTAWRALSDDLDARSGRGTEADRVTRAANDWFAVYEHCAASAAPGRERTNA